MKKKKITRVACSSTSRNYIWPVGEGGGVHKSRATFLSLTPNDFHLCSPYIMLTGTRRSFKCLTVITGVHKVTTIAKILQHRIIFQRKRPFAQVP